MLERLVGIPTVSRDSNLALIDFVEDYLAGHGVATHRVPNADGTKANLWATIGRFLEDPAWFSLRPPLVELSQKQRDELAADLDKLGFKMPGLRQQAETAPA